MRRCDDIVSAYLKYTSKQESPTNYHLWCILSVIASCLRRQLWIDMGYYKIYPNMYVILVSPPGKARKSVSINTAINLVNHLPEIKVTADSITREALIKALVEATTTLEMDDKRIYTHSSITIVSKELSVFLGKDNHNLLSLLTDLYDCANKWEYRTKNMGVDSLNNVCVNLLGATTSDWLVGSIPLSAIGGGFTSRVIFVVEEQVRCRVPMPKLTPAEKQLRDDISHDLEIISLLKGSFRMTDEASKFYEDWYIQSSNYHIDKKFWGYMERKHTHLLKVSMLLSVSRSNDLIITLDDITTALQLLNNLEPKMIDAFGAAGRSPMALDIGDVSDVIRNVGTITKKQLLKGIWRDVAPESLDKSLLALRQMGFISETLDNKTGNIVYKWIHKEE